MSLYKTLHHAVNAATMVFIVYNAITAWIRQLQVGGYWSLPFAFGPDEEGMQHVTSDAFVL